MCVCVYMFVYVYMSVYLHVYVYVFMCVCVKYRLFSKPPKMKDYTNITELLVCVYSMSIVWYTYIISTYILIRVCVCVCVCVFMECVLSIIVAFFSPQAKCILQNI